MSPTPRPTHYGRPSIASMCERWAGIDRPLFKSCLIDSDGYCCAQGDVLRCSGVTDKELHAMSQTQADRQVANLLGISYGHSSLLRVINDQQDGCPRDVLLHPERILGDQASRVLTFWRRIDAMKSSDWSAVLSAAAKKAACSAAWSAAKKAARNTTSAAAKKAVCSAAWSDVWNDVWNAAWDDACAVTDTSIRLANSCIVNATYEIQGADILRKRGHPFYFLPLFGIADPAELAQERPMSRKNSKRLLFEGGPAFNVEWPTLKGSKGLARTPNSETAAFLHAWIVAMARVELNDPGRAASIRDILGLDAARPIVNADAVLMGF